MKKATIVSVVLALMVAANAAIDRVPIMKKDGGRRNHLKLNSVLRKNAKREPDSCFVITCVEVGDTCSDEDPSRVCMNDESCTNGICGFVEGSQCNYGYCSTNEDNLYCNDDEDKCYARKGEGESCHGYTYECQDGFFCNTSDEFPSACIPNPKKAGDPCGSCPSGLKCYNDVCHVFPSTVGAVCEVDVGCNNDTLYCDGTCKEFPKAGEDCYTEDPYCATGLYCNNDNKCSEPIADGGDCSNGGECAAGLYCNDEDKCVKLPGENAECISEEPYCADGFYCNDENKCTKLPGENAECLPNSPQCADGFYCNDADNLCVELPGAGEECTESYQCKGDLACTSHDGSDPFCYDPEYIAPAGAKCFDGGIKCQDGYICDPATSRCVVGECTYDYDCPEEKGCAGGHCVDYMSLDDGAECNGNTGAGFFACKVGSGCIPNDESSTGYACAKIQTKLTDEVECTEGGDECSSDSMCECNSLTGKMQCIPYPDSDPDALEFYKKALVAGDEDEEEYYFQELMLKYYPFDVDTRCYSYDALSTSSSSSSSSSQTKPVVVEDSSSSSTTSKAKPIVSEESSSPSSSSTSKNGNGASTMKPIAFLFSMLLALF